MERRALASSRGVKRKSATPDVHFSSDDEEGDSSDLATSDSDASRKRVKSSVSSVDSFAGPRRKILSEKAFRDYNGGHRFIHGAEATSGEYASLFKPPWDAELFRTVELQYPSRCARERFEIKWPRQEKDDYKPMEDIIQTIHYIAKYYFPPELSRKYTDDSTGLERRFNRAYKRESIDEFVGIVEDFNSVLTPLLQDGTVERELRRKHGLELDWIQRILDQIFVRTVSPKAEKLNAYKNGSDNVYGELLPRFVSNIFKATHLNHEQTFIDLGSGVGNVVLQAALEVGCESHGIEVMPNPCDLAELQAREFAGRTRLWGLDVGQVKLLRGDMTTHPDIPALLQRADVVLVNNQAFTPALNDKLRDMFLDLKVGCRVVSLKPFVPEGHKMAVRNIDNVVNQFRQTKHPYFSDSVSWSHYGNGHYYIATKDLKPLKAFRRKMGLD